MRGSIKWQVQEVWKRIDGIGQSKAESRITNGMDTLSGNQVKSEYVHSFKYKDEVLRTATELANYAKEHFGVKDMQAISNEVVQSYLENKIENGATYRTVSTYIGHLDKIQTGLSKIEAKLPQHQNLFDREILREIRDIAKETAKENIHTAREYINPEKIIENLRTEESKIVAKLQLQEGLRVKEALLIKENQLEENKLTFQGKGGYILSKEITPELAKELKEYINTHGEFKTSYNAYYKELKEAVKEAGEKWSGTHGFRYNYAHSQMEKYQEQGYSYREALKATSEDMGHNREEITEHYLK